MTKRKATRLLRSLGFSVHSRQGDSVFFWHEPKELWLEVHVDAIGQAYALVPGDSPRMRQLSTYEEINEFADTGRDDDKT